MNHSIADLAAESLVANGIDTLYGLPGLQLDPFLDACYRRRDRLRFVHTRHEQGAAYMAMGANLVTGRPQAYCTVAGAGFLNSAAALSTAIATHARIIALVGQIPHRAIGKGFGLLHEIRDELAIMRSLTKQAESVVDPGTAAEALRNALRALKSGAPGPVGIGVPMDLWNSEVAVDGGLSVQDDPAPEPDMDAVAAAARLMRQSKSPMIIVGSGALDHSEEVCRLSAALSAPVVSFRNGHGVMSSDEQLRISMPTAHELWPKVDLAIGLGTRLQMHVQDWGADERLSIIHVTLDEAELGRVAPPTIGICADLAQVLPSLLELVEGAETPRGEWVRTAVEEKARTEARVRGKLAAQLDWLSAIRAELPRDGIFVDELTQLGYVSRFAFPVYGPRTYVSPGYQGTLGFGYAAALGAAHARRDAPVVNICGDGGALFTLNELATGVLHEIPLTTVVFADGYYGNVRGLQRDHYGARYIGNELANPDFAKFAESFGAQGLRAETPDELRSALREGMAHGGPTIIEVPVGEFNSPWEFVLMSRNRGV